MLRLLYFGHFAPEINHSIFHCHRVAWNSYLPLKVNACCGHDDDISPPVATEGLSDVQRLVSFRPTRNVATFFDWNHVVVNKTKTPKKYIVPVTFLYNFSFLTKLIHSRSQVSILLYIQFTSFGDKHIFLKAASSRILRAYGAVSHTRESSKSYKSDYCLPRNYQLSALENGNHRQKFNCKRGRLQLKSSLAKPCRSLSW